MVTGSRNWHDKDRLWAVFDSFKANDYSLVVGDCPTGADSLALRYAKEHNWSCRVFVADWTRYGRTAGPIRNQEMVSQHAPAVDVFVICNKGNSRGTADCTRRIETAARKRGAQIVYLREP